MTTPTEARRYVLDYLQEHLAGLAVLDDAVLVVSELVTNAVTASADAIVVDVDLHRSHLVVGVTDDAPGVPQRQQPSLLSATGRGLWLVDSLARRWGTQPRPFGKRVWAVLIVEDFGGWECHLPLTG